MKSISFIQNNLSVWMLIQKQLNMMTTILNMLKVQRLTVN